MIDCRVPRTDLASPPIPDPPTPSAMHEVSTILNTGLDRQSLRILVNLCEAGVNPEALATGECEVPGAEALVAPGHPPS